MRAIRQTQTVVRPALSVWVIPILLSTWSGSPGAALAQENRALEEGEAFEQSVPGNVVQQAQMIFGQGKRSLDRAERLAEKADAAPTDEKRDKLLEKRSAALEAAVSNLMEALRLQPQMIEGYEALGKAFRRLGKHQEALEIHAIALRRDPQSLENFEGWAESLLALDMLGNATTSYTSYVESNRERADILMTEMKKWLAVKQADPGGIDPADVERMAAWIEQQERGG